MDSLVRDSDRFWWALLMIGLASCVAAVILPWHFWNQFSADEPYTTPSDYGLTVSLGLVCLILAAVVFTKAAQARDRHQKRVAALRGDLSDMPLATIQPDPAQAPDVAAQPLEVMWRMSGPSAIGRLLILGLQCLGLLVSVGAIPFLLITSIFTPATRTKPVSASEIAITVATTAVFIALVMVAIRYLIRVVPTLFGRPFGVRGAADGIERRGEFGARSFIAWDEVRLFEVMGAPGYATRSFALYAPGKSIIWREYWTGTGSEYAPAGATASENAQRQAALLNLITARTGLEPRTMTHALRRDFIAVPASAPQAGTLALAVFALCYWALAIGEYLFPITPYAWANLPSVAALSLLGLNFTVLAVMTAVRRRRAVSRAEPPSVASPPLDSLDSAYALSWRVPTSRRARFTIGGLLLAVNLIPAAIVAPQAFSVDAGFWHVALGGVTGALGLAGVIIILSPAFGGRSMTVSIRADAAGLTRSDGTRTTLIPWSMMREIIWRAHGLGDFPAYMMLTDNPLEAITWPTAPRYLVASTPSDGALPIGPDELAALVAARIGQDIRVSA